MFIIDLLTRNGRARRKATKLIRGKDQVPVTTESILICIKGLRAVYKDLDRVEDASDILIGLYYEPEELIAHFREGSRMILDEESPERRRYEPKMSRITLPNWLWDNDGMRLNWVTFIGTLLDTVEEFNRLLADQYEISGKAVAGYRLEQMYYPLCDIISLTEAFYAE